MWNKQRFIEMARQAQHFMMQVLLPSRKVAGGNAASEYLDNQYFARVVLITVMLHALAIYAYNSMPREVVVDIPVRVLNIKLGDIEMAQESQDAASQPNSGNNAKVEDTLSKLVKDTPRDDAKSDAVSDNPADPSKKSAKATAKPDASQPDYLSKLAAAPKQYVRAGQIAPNQRAGSSGATNAEIMRMYEKHIALWIQKFKVYPDEARNQNMQGETVVRIRIDRQGNIIYRILERSTGYQQLDRAALDMISRANPVPAVPNDYPQGDLMEFLIPVTFNLHE